MYSIVSYLSLEKIQLLYETITMSNITINNQVYTLHLMRSFLKKSRYTTMQKKKQDQRIKLTEKVDE